MLAGSIGTTVESGSAVSTNPPTWIERWRGITVDLATLPMDDQAVYDDLCAADTIGVFQVESRAQMNTLPRLKPRCFYDLVVEVAIIRPGPIQGDMVHPYLRRRAGLEKVDYPHPSLEPILKRTLGVPLFQEQGMQVAIAAAGFSPGEADQLRRAMGHKRSRERMAAICQKMLDGMAANGIAPDIAQRIFNQINGFADYGFPESHAASFALLVYASAYLKHYYAPEFTAAILNAQPMGFYAPGTLVEDARRHGVEVRPADVTRSQWDATLEPREEQVQAKSKAPAVRLGIRSVRGLGAAARDRLERALAEGPFTSVEDVVRRSGLDQRGLRHLAEAGALDNLLPHEPDVRARRAALWAVLDAARGDAGPLAPRGRAPSAASAAPLPSMSRVELTEADYRMTGISLGGHPMSHVRGVLALNEVRSARDLLRNGRDGDGGDGGARDLPPAAGHGEGIRLPHAGGRDGADQRGGDAAAVRAPGAADLAHAAAAGARGAPGGADGGEPAGRAVQGPAGRCGCRVRAAARFPLSVKLAP